MQRTQRTMSLSYYKHIKVTASVIATPLPQIVFKLYAPAVDSRSALKPHFGTFVAPNVKQLFEQCGLQYPEILSQIDTVMLQATGTRGCNSQCSLSALNISLWFRLVTLRGQINDRTWQNN